MKKRILLTVLLFTMLSLMSVAFAGTVKTVTLSVEGMTCSMCPITVKKALRNVDGVTDVVAKYEGAGQGWAKVSYDIEKADVDDLIFATEQAGYPSIVSSLNK